MHIKQIHNTLEHGHKLPELIGSPSSEYDEAKLRINALHFIFKALPLPTTTPKAKALILRETLAHFEATPRALQAPLGMSIH